MLLNTCRSDRNTIASLLKGATNPDMGLALLTTCLLGGGGLGGRYFVENRGGWPWKLGLFGSQLSTEIRVYCTRITLVPDTVTSA